MERQTLTFKSEYRAFGYVFAALVTLCTLPVTAWHYWQTLEGFALLGIGGLALADCVLWFASHWAGKVRSGVLKAVTLGVKFALAGVMVGVAALCIILMRADRDFQSIAKLARENRTAEIEARAKAAADLTAAGNRAAARDILKTAGAESVSSIADRSRQGLEARVPAWLSTWGIYILPPLCALLGALVLSIAATIAGSREEGPSRDPLPHWPNESPVPASNGNGYGSGKPVMVWQGGTARPQ
jgi:hypothetical protein